MSLRSGVFAADLLYVLAEGDRSDWNRESQRMLAELVGMTLESVEVPASTLQVALKGTPSPEPDPRQPLLHDAIRQVFWRVESDMAVTPRSHDAPEWLRPPDAADLSPARYISMPGVRPPQPAPLVTAEALGHLLRHALGRHPDLRRPHWPRVVERVAQGRLVDPMPSQETSRALRGTVQVVIDLGEVMQPFRSDLRSVLQFLRQAWGERLREFVTTNGLPAQDGPRDGSLVVVLGDAGLCGPAMRRQAWMAWARRVGQTGVRPLVLAPVPLRWLTEEARACCDVVLLDQGQKALQVQPPGRSEAQAHAGTVAPPDVGVRWLRGCLFAHSYVQPALLRRLRLALQRAGLPVDIGTELAVWHDDAVIGEDIACALRPEAVEDARATLRQLNERHPAAMAAVVREHLADLRARSPLLRAAFASEWGQPELMVEDATLRHELTDWQRSGRELMQSATRVLRASGRRALKTDLVSHQVWLGRHQPCLLGRADVALRAAWVAAQADRLRQGRVDVPEGVDLADLGWALPEEVPGDEPPHLLSLSVRATPTGGMLEVYTTSGLSDASLINGMAVRGGLTVERGQRDANLLLGDGGVLPLEDHRSCLIKSDRREVTVASFHQPAWAESIEFNHGQWHARIPDGRTLTWVPKQRIPLAGGVSGSDFVLPHGAWRAIDDADRYKLAKGHVFMKPGWAVRHGADACGVWAEFEVRGVTQRLRWIAPGEFLMGSPEDEIGRDDNEHQHLVLLTQGYWLADTACTQELWEAVMGENPSNFKNDPQNPVEGVSWNDIKQEFLPRLKKMVPELNLTLPTEAQWEYACRAGTTKPFSLGDKIYQEQMNFDGKRGKTVAVKSLPENLWGLHQMHGNVWEWCQDEFAEYSEGTSIDPGVHQDKNENSQRVLRGGSWNDLGGLCRSAYRHAGGPDGRSTGFGFRLARLLADQINQNLEIKRYRIFLASPPDLVADQRELVDFINQKIERWRTSGIFLDLVIWERFPDGPDEQEEFYKDMQSCDLCVRIFGSNAGLHTIEKYEKLRQQFTTIGRPYIYTYFNVGKVAEAAASQSRLNDVLEFKKILGVLGYFNADYRSPNELCENFDKQLSGLNFESGALSFPQRKTISTGVATGWKSSKK